MTDLHSNSSSHPSDAGEHPVRVALLNDYDLVVEGLAGMLAPFGDIDVVQKAVGDTELDEPVDVALFDTYGRQSVPWEDLRDLLASEAARHVVLFTFAMGPELVRRAMDQGLSGCLWKGMSRGDLAGSLRRIAKGEQVITSPGSHGRVPPDGYRWPLAELRLTPRESEVLALLAEGMTNRAIADAMGLGRETVKSHVREVFLKLGVHTRSEATNRVLRDPAFAHQPRQLIYRKRAAAAEASPPPAASDAPAPPERNGDGPPGGPAASEHDEVAAPASWGGGGGWTPAG